MRNKQKILYDKKKDILYILIKKGIEERFEDITEDITVEYDAKNKPIGIEIFNASKVLGEKLGVKADSRITHSPAVAHKIR